MNTIADTEVKHHDTLEVLDSTKIKTYMACPRKFFFSYVLGWNPQNTSHDLVFGASVHSCLESIYRDWMKEGKGYRDEQLLKGLSRFVQTYREEFPPETDSEVGPKNPNSFARLLMLYADTYAHDNFEVLYTEIAGSICVGTSAEGKQRDMYMVLDTVCRDQKGEFILEHKTSKWGTYLWSKSFEQSIQVGVGNHVLHCLYDKPYGMVINGLLFRAKEPEFKRLPIPMSPLQMEDWLVTVNSYFDMIYRDLDKLTESTDKEAVLKCFPKNETACLQFNRVCPYADVCQGCANPLRNVNPPIGFKQEYWDPRVREKREGVLMFSGEKPVE